ncbi:major tail subunit [Serratia phage KSP100]|uniref:Major tail subunit n=1 Tax=Serratia phage KSP100 TaxID=552529 RepID=B9A7D9_BPSK1|nr:major tail subunit [Serratia phage KSP100]
MSLKVGDTLTLTAAAENSVSVKWQKDGADIDGATSATYTKSNVALTDAGSYTAVFTGKKGDTATTNPATVTVTEGETPVESVAIAGAKKRYVKKGSKLPLSVTVSPDGAPQEIKATSSDPSVATVA